MKRLSLVVCAIQVFTFNAFAAEKPPADDACKVDSDCEPKLTGDNCCGEKFACLNKATPPGKKQHSPRPYICDCVNPKPTKCQCVSNKCEPATSKQSSAIKVSELLLANKLYRGA